MLTHSNATRFGCLAGVFCAVASWMPATVSADCGKHMVVLRPGVRGALAEVIVQRMMAESMADDSHGPARPCDAPQCRKLPALPVPAVPSAPNVSSAERSLELWFAATLKTSTNYRFRRNVEDRESLYSFDVAPPPTPPPNA